MHICVSKLTIIGSDNGLSPDRRQAIIRTNAGILLIGPLGINSSEILIEILTFSFKKMRLKVSSAKRRPFCLGLNVLIHWGRDKRIVILQTTSKMFEFRLNFHNWRLVSLAWRRQAITWTNDDTFQWCIEASSGPSVKRLSSDITGRCYDLNCRQSKIKYITVLANEKCLSTHRW